MPTILALTTDALAVAVLAMPHEWSGALSITHRFPCTVDAGKTGREARRPATENQMLSVRVHLILSGDEAQAWRQQLATIGSGWVGVPIWPDRRLGSDAANFIYHAQRLLDLTAGAIVAGDSVLNGAHEYAPLLVGHLAVLPEHRADMTDQIDFSFSVVEDSPWALRIGINGTQAAGNWPAALAPDWSNSGPRDQPEDGLDFEQIGMTRERTIEGLEQAFRWKQTAEFTLVGRAQIVALLAFFTASEGLRRKFTAPWWIAPGTPTAEAPATTTVRFGSDSLTLDFIGLDLASVKLQLVQLPWEIDGVVGETPEQPPRVAYYKYTYALPTPQIYRFTNWVKPLARAGDGTYAPAPMQHREILGGLDLRNERVMVDSFIFAGNPLTLWHPNQIEAPLTLEIFESESWPVDPDTAVRRVVGDVKKPRVQGRTLEAPVIFLSSLLDRELPRVTVGANCNTTFCSSRCKLILADYLKTGTFTSAAGCVIDVVTTAAQAANYFALGKLSLGVGLAWEGRQIKASEPIAGGQRLTVDWPIRQAAAGQAIAFYPGCARTGDACRAWGNYPNFRGHEHVPIINLAIPSMALPTAPGKK